MPELPGGVPRFNWQWTICWCPGNVLIKSYRKGVWPTAISFCWFRQDFMDLKFSSSLWWNSENQSIMESETPHTNGNSYHLLSALESNRGNLYSTCCGRDHFQNTNMWNRFLMWHKICADELTSHSSAQSFHRVITLKIPFGINIGEMKVII